MNWRPLARVTITLAIVLLLDLWFANAHMPRTSVRVSGDDSANSMMRNTMTTTEKRTTELNGHGVDK